MKKLAVKDKYTKQNIRKEFLFAGLYGEFATQPNSVNVPFDADIEKPRSTRNSKGWLLSHLLAWETVENGRWFYWYKAKNRKRIPTDPIPQLWFHESGESAAAYKMIDKCVEKLRYNTWDAFQDLVDWLLWGLGWKDARFPEINDDQDNWLYRNFDLKLLLDPADHLGYYYENAVVSRYKQKANGFFSTPIDVCNLMARMIYGKETDKSAAILEPCAGTGKMLMVSSNYSLNLRGMDIDGFLVKICILNGYLFMPWLVAPDDFVDNHNELQRKKIEDVLAENSPSKELAKAILDGLPDGHPYKKAIEKAVETHVINK